MSPADPETLPEGWTENTVQANGIEIHYTRTGDPDATKPPLVVCHGVFDDGRCRTPLARDLANEFDVILVDARGHGCSDAPAEGYEIPDRVADLVGFLDALDIEDPYLFGHSMGGDTVAATAAVHPDLPRAIAIEDPAGMLEHDQSGPDVAEEADGLIEFWRDHTKAELLEADDEIRGHVEAGNDDLARLIADARRRVSPHITAVFDAGWVEPSETYPEIEVPALILKADADEDERARNRENAEHLPGGKLVHVEDTGHTVFRDDRETATRELRTFLDSV